MKPSFKEQTPSETYHDILNSSILDVYARGEMFYKNKEEGLIIRDFHCPLWEQRWNFPLF